MSLSSRLPGAGRIPVCATEPWRCLGTFAASHVLGRAIPVFPTGRAYRCGLCVRQFVGVLVFTDGEPFGIRRVDYLQSVGTLTVLPASECFAGSIMPLLFSRYRWLASSLRPGGARHTGNPRDVWLNWMLLARGFGVAGLIFTLGEASSGLQASLVVCSSRTRSEVGSDTDHRPGRRCTTQVVCACLEDPYASEGCSIHQSWPCNG